MKKNDFDVIVPISIDIDWPTKESTIRDILEQKRVYGITSFALACPCGGWRSIGYPPSEFFVEKANLFKEIKEELAPYGVKLSWWITLTLKSGKTEGFQSMVKSNGEEHPFANCPLCDNFKDRFASDVATFAKIAKPESILTEDDFSISAAMGCFCPLHIAEFNKRYGYDFTREELVKVLDERGDEAIAVIKNWRELLRDSQVEFANKIRTELDRESPEIPVGYMQPGYVDRDGECTEAISRALAGPNHTPFSRIYGADYGGIQSRYIPLMLFHLLYSKQHIGENFKFLFEADTFPHTRFFSAAKHMMGAMSVAFSYGFEGAIFQTQQLLDGANEEKAYGIAFKKSRKRFEEISDKAKMCTLRGVGLKHDALYNTIDPEITRESSLWVHSIARFGIPYTTLDSDVLFWDVRQTKNLSDEEIKAALSKTLFIDSEAAKALCDRGYGKFIGVSVGDNVLNDERFPKLVWDLGTREVIRPEFAKGLVGRNMTSAWMLAPNGNGKLLELNVEDENCEVITDYYTYSKEYICPSMTRFENSLGGKVVVMGLTLNRNHSQALFNYRRKHLIQNLIKWAKDDYVLVPDVPEVFVIENESKDKKEFNEMLTLLNLCEDTLDSVPIHLPPRLKNFKNIYILKEDCKWKKAKFERTDDGILVKHPLEFCDAMYLIIK